MSGTILGATVANAEVLVNKLVQAFEEWTSEDINDAYWDEQFRDMGLWEYDGQTLRRNGEVVDSPRDIYDTGELYRSGIESYDFNVSRNTAMADWRWDARNSSGRYYAYYVHEGQGTNLTARPWTDELAIPQKFDNSIVKKALLRRIKISMGTK